MQFYLSPLIFWIFLANLHAVSRAHRSCHSVSSWDRSSSFEALGLRWWGSPGKSFQAMDFWSRVFAWRTTALVIWTHRIGFRMLELFRKIDEDFATQLSCTFQHGYFTFVTILLRPFAGLFVNLAVCVRALISQFASIFGLVEQAFWRMSFFTEWKCASSLEVILAGQSRHSSTWASASRTSGSRCISHILPRGRSRRRIRLCRFCTLILTVSETAIVSFRALPVCFSLPTIS